MPESVRIGDASTPCCAFTPSNVKVPSPRLIGYRFVNQNFAARLKTEREESRMDRCR